MIKKVVYISFVNINERIFKDYFGEFLVQKNIEIEFWDLTKLLFNSINENQHKFFCRVVKINSYSEYNELLLSQNSKNTVFVLLIEVALKFYKILKPLKMYDLKTVFFLRGILPSVKLSKKNKFIYFARYFCKSVGNFFLAKFDNYYLKYFSIQVGILFYAGRVSLSSSIRSQNKININLSDYDSFILSQSSYFVKHNYKYAVFLDINITNHNDDLILKNDRINSKVYFDELNNFFDVVEKKFSLRIIIAAHPTSNYDFNPFKGRDIVYMQTSEIVKFAEFVITHHSTSISFAILNKKPIIFVYSNEIKVKLKFSIMLHIDAQSKYLKSNVINMSDIDNLEIFPIDRNRYNNFKYDFITSIESENEKSCDIFWIELNKYIYK
jgi:hypothetical protein